MNFWSKLIIIPPKGIFKRLWMIWKTKRNTYKWLVGITKIVRIRFHGFLATLRWVFWAMFSHNFPFSNVKNHILTFSSISQKSQKLQKSTRLQRLQGSSYRQKKHRAGLLTAEKSEKIFSSDWVSNDATNLGQNQSPSIPCFWK